MFSLPFVAPRPDASLFPSTRPFNPSFDNPTHDPSVQQQHVQRRQMQPGLQHAPAARYHLAAITADENIIANRFRSVRRFGAGWIRPPGIAKTYQATMDEQAEREEQEALAHREQVMLDLQAAQEAQANTEAAAQGEDEDMEGERDLDDEVPEADVDESEVSGDEEVSSLVEEGNTSAIGVSGLDGAHDMTFNEDSLIEDSMMAAQVEHMLEREEAEIEGTLQEERDLDDEIPEGSYEHTETSLEESSSAEEEEASLAGSNNTSFLRRSLGGSTRRHSGISARRRNRSSVGIEGSSSVMDGSSFLRSSPAARTSQRGRGGLPGL